MAPIVALKSDARVDTYEELTSKRTHIRARVTVHCKTVAEWKKSTNDPSMEDILFEDRTLSDLQGRLNHLNELISALMKTPQTADEQKQRDEWNERCIEYEEKTSRALSVVEVFRERIRARERGRAASMANSSTTEGSAQMVLTKDIVVKKEKKIPSFSGDAKKFQEWYGLFESAVSDRVNKLDKFEKLKSCLSGNALKAIAHLQLKEELYDTALSIIKEEYGSVFSAQYAYAADIIKTCSTKNFRIPDKWHVVVPSLSQSIKALQSSLEGGFAGAAIMILPMVLDNLPSSVRDSFLRVHEVSETDEAVKQLEALLKFLAKRVGSGDHSCIFCNLNNHSSAKCKKVLTNYERADTVRNANACAKCLRRNHTAAKCRIKTKCKHCSGAHHSLLCVKECSSNDGQTSTMMNVTVLATGTVAPEPEGIANVTHRISKSSNLATGYANVVTEKGFRLRRLMIDSGSQRSYVTNRLAKALKATVVNREQLINHTLGGRASEVREYLCYRINLTSRFAPQESIPVECLGIPVITDSIFPPAERLGGISEFADLVEDPEFKEIDILLGTDDLGQIWLNESRSEGRLMALKQDSVVRPSEKGAAQLSYLGSNRQQKRNCSRDASLDELFKANISRNKDGRYRLKLIFNENLQSLGDNEKIAINRLNSLISRSSKEVLEAIDEEMEKYIKEGYAELAPKRKPGEFVHYLPLQVVKKPDQGSPRGFKLRIVKDAGCRSKDLASLNDVLITGYNLLQNILLVLTKFRESPIAVVADVEKAYHQFEIDRSHRTFLRYYYRPGVSRNAGAPIKEFWSKRLDFGTSASPWLYQAGLKFHLDGEKTRRPSETEFINELQFSCYMDDLSFGSVNQETALTKIQRCVEIFRSGHFPLKKWATNSEEVAEGMRQAFSDETVSIRSAEPDFRFLGIRWCQVTDALGVFVTNANRCFNDAKPSKRSLLSGLAQIYDPLGIICPISIHARVLFQMMWQDKVQWDDRLNAKHRELYGEFVRQLKSADRILVSRTNARIDRLPRRTEIHAFSDASKVAYGAVIYLKEFFQDGDPEIKFLMAKAKVAPNKANWNIHRLELMAALVSCRLVEKLRPALGNTVKRITEIQRFSTPDQWRYVATKSNPADLLSRGNSLESRESVEFWLNGPSWLKEQKLPDPIRIGKEEFAEAIAEAKHGNVAETDILHVTALPKVSSSLLKEKHFSSWPKAVRSLAYVRRVFQKARKRDLSMDIPVQVEEYLDAERALIRNLQQMDFPTEVASGGRKLPKTSKLYLYNPMVDEHGILRCKSGLIKSGDLSFGEKYPIILDGRNYFTKLLIAWIHKSKCLHSPGITTNLHHIRAEYLILRERL
ncbi:uncharacterized protein LOC100904608, partial [Galendromus occidentalis]|uniref:Uncharacterized protein LOC100904608 n=1 Tax=Galendromus occidentalis TaxID=34638 RepID=A0AAJ6QSC2_9ACAR